MSDSPAPRDSASPPQSRSPSPVAHDTLTLRALVSTKDAGVIIGKAGKNVADLREQTGVKAGVSKVIQGVHERVLTVTGPVEGVAKAYTLIISQLVATNPTSPIISSPSSVHTSIRLLISHNLMGTIIGRNGLKIKAIQDGSGTRMVASKDMLPQSTERIVEVQGAPDAIGHAIEEIGKCLLEDWERGLGTVLFHPGTGDDRSANRRSVNGLPPSYGTPRRANGRASPPSSPAHAPIPRTRPTRRESAYAEHIHSLGYAPHDETGERMFTIIGTPEANEKALFLLYNQLESEKERRVNKETHQQDMQE
ncbi:KH domain RNA-binding protein [Mycena venus]|uniref:KH domain RNA-binding protein n=1 Tax=Mycena venus TaxID=2733690 RepID=A0A8H6XVZ9_9AGAR|nr:KH domain RNA-binding protein [Mycena venus]